MSTVGNEQSYDASLVCKASIHRAVVAGADPHDVRSLSQPRPARRPFLSHNDVNREYVRVYWLTRIKGPTTRTGAVSRAGHHEKQGASSSV